MQSARTPSSEASPSDVLSERQRAALSEVTAVAAEEARLFARRTRSRYAMTALWEQAPGPDDFGIIELAGTARIGQSRASTELADSRRMVELFGATLALLDEGQVYAPAVQLLLSATRNCTDQVAVEVERRLLALMKEADTTELRRRLSETVLQVEVDLDPDATELRQRAAREDRAVWINPLPDGMCQVGASLDDLTGRRWCLDFEELVRAQAVADKQAGVNRTRNQRRADVFAALPSQLLALLRAVASGNLDSLRELALRDPEVAEQVEVLANDVRDLTSPDAPIAGEEAPAPTEREVMDQGTGLGEGMDSATDLALSAEQLAVALIKLRVQDPREIQVHIPMSTLLDLDQRCGWVEGIGAVTPQRVRLMLPVAGLRRVVVDPDSGIPHHLDRQALPPQEPLDWNDDEAVNSAARQLRERLLSLIEPVVVTDRAGRAHDPTKALHQLIALRDRTCTGVGCGMPARQCHDDHEVPYPKGPTAEWNLSAKSPRCHHAKHHGWDVVRDERTGTSIWRSPLGHTYTVRTVWRPPPEVPSDIELPPPVLRQEEPRPFYDDSTWNTPLSLPERPAPPTPRSEDRAKPSTWDDQPPF